MDDHSPILIAPHVLVDYVSRLAGAADMNERWETSVAIARELGADALNVVRFHTGNPVPVWFRVSTHERGGMEEYIARNYMTVDPVLVSFWDGSMKEVDHISLHREIAEKDLSDMARECYDHLLAHGQSDYITFRLRDSQDDTKEVLVVFSCTADVAAEFNAQIDQLAVIANLFAVYVGPPTPGQPEGKVPLLYDFLSPRESDVLTCLARGMHNSEIAHALGITEVTVRMHTTSARKKMRAATRAQAIALALVRNLITV
jgi:DNA-binding CsgD family transcriptional regulator